MISSDKVFRVVLWFSAATAVAMAVFAWFLVNYYEQTCFAALAGQRVPPSFQTLHPLLYASYAWAAVSLGISAFSRPPGRSVMLVISLAGNVALLMLIVMVAAWCALDFERQVSNRPPTAITAPDGSKWH